MNAHQRQEELREAVKVERFKRNGDQAVCVLIEEVLDLAERVAAVEAGADLTVRYTVDHERRVAGVEASLQKYIRVFQALLARLGVEKGELVDAAVEQAVREALTGDGGRDGMPEPNDPATREALRRARGEIDPGCCGG